MTLIPANLTPPGSRLLIKPIVGEAKTEAGLYIGETLEKKNPPVGEVLAIGPDVQLMVSSLSGTRGLYPGDKVVYERGSSTSYFTDISRSNTELHIVNEQYVLLTIAK